MKQLKLTIKLILYILKSIILFIWCLPQNIVGFIYRIFGGYRRSRVSEWNRHSQKSKSMKDVIKDYNDSFYYWKNVYNFNTKKHGKTNMWVIGNFVFFKISMATKVHNYSLPYSDLQFASGYRILSNIFGPLYLLVILIPTLLRNFRYDHFYSKKHKGEPTNLKLYWYNWWITKLVNKVISKKPEYPKK